MYLMIRATLLSIFILIFQESIFAETIRGRVVKVFDGDTVTILDASNTQHRIRLQGIDAPERGQAYGKKSGRYLADAVAGKHVDVDYEKLDRYKRIVGKVLLDGQDMNLRQVKAGLAWHYKKYQKERSKFDRLLYSSAEDEARAKKIGLWSVPAVAPWATEDPNAIKAGSPVPSSN